MVGDIDFIAADFLAFMVDRALQSHAIVTAPKVGCVVQPLCAVFSHEFLPLAEDALSPWLPLIDEGGRVRALVDLFRLRSRRPTLPNAAVIMAGGRGQRLLPHTANTPKPLMQVGGRPILETLIRILHGHGFERFYLSVNYLADHIEAHFGDGSGLGVTIDYLREDRPLGTAHAGR